MMARVEQVGTVPQILLAPSTFTLGLAGLLLLLGCCSLWLMVVGAVADEPVVVAVAPVKLEVALFVISEREDLGLAVALA